MYRACPISPGLFSWDTCIWIKSLVSQSAYLTTKHNIKLPLLGSNQRPILLVKTYDHWAMCSTCLKSIKNSETWSFTCSRSTVYIYFQIVIWRFTNPIIIIFFIRGPHRKSIGIGQILKIGNISKISPFWFNFLIF